MSDLSVSLTVAHLSWAIWANHSQSLIWFEQNEQMSDERIPSPAFLKIYLFYKNTFFTNIPFLQIYLLDKYTFFTNILFFEIYLLDKYTFFKYTFSEIFLIARNSPWKVRLVFKVYSTDCCVFGSGPLHRGLKWNWLFECILQNETSCNFISVYFSVIIMDLNFLYAILKW